LDNYLITLQKQIYIDGTNNIFNKNKAIVLVIDGKRKCFYDDSLYINNASIINNLAEQKDIKNKISRDNIFSKNYRKKLNILEKQLELLLKERDILFQSLGFKKIE
jgi:hypothetical protein